jgi:hypothetical protein
VQAFSLLHLVLTGSGSHRAGHNITKKGDDKYTQNFSRKIRRKELLGRLRRRWKNDIKVDLYGIKREGEE